MGRRKKANPNFKAHSHLDPQRRKAVKGIKKVDEHALKTIDGASMSIPVGYVMPCTSLLTGDRALFEVTRVDTEIDAVYGVELQGLPCPWWEYNSTHGVYAGQGD